MQRAIIFFAALTMAVSLGHEARAQQSCNCPKNLVCKCGPKGWTSGSGGVVSNYLPVPAETMVAGMAYVLKPDAEKQAYLQTLSSQDRQFILANVGALTTSVQSLQADHMLYQQEVRRKTMAPQR